MDTSGLNKSDDPNGLGLWHIKASSFTVDDKIELSRLVDELASWFDSKMWSSVFWLLACCRLLSFANDRYREA